MWFMACHVKRGLYSGRLAPTPALDPSVPQSHLIDNRCDQAVFSDQLRIISKPKAPSDLQSTTASWAIRLIGHEPPGTKV